MKFTPKTGLIAITFLSSRAQAAEGNVLVGNNIETSATVCLDIGAMASLTGLDNLALTAESTDGEAGSVYIAEDQFHLESNAPVRVLIESGQLNNGDYILNASYEIDGETNEFQTEMGVTHNADHSLTARVELGRISQQLAGDYIGNISITVIPQEIDKQCK